MTNNNADYTPKVPSLEPASYPRGAETTSSSYPGNPATQAATTIHSKKNPHPYVLVTPAYNESEHIGDLIDSIIRQTRPPLRWVIVADGCTDQTVSIVRSWMAAGPFIELVELPPHRHHNFSSKVKAFNSGAERLDRIPYSFIGNLDADVAVGPSYFEELLDNFGADSRLGVAGGAVWDFDGAKLRPQRFNTSTDVAGGTAMFRRECYEAINGFLPLTHGGEDWAAQVTARMNGWRVRTFPELRVLHNCGRINRLALLRRGFRDGLMDFALGTHPLFELARLARRFRTAPLALVCMARLLGFVSGYFRRKERLVSGEFVRFLRAEQKLKLHDLVHSCLGAPNGRVMSQYGEAGSERAETSPPQAITPRA